MQLNGNKNRAAIIKHQLIDRHNDRLQQDTEAHTKGSKSNLELQCSSSVQLYSSSDHIYLQLYWSIFIYFFNCVKVSCRPQVKINTPARHTLLSFERSKKSNRRPKSIVYQPCFSMWISSHSLLLAVASCNAFEHGFMYGSSGLRGVRLVSIKL